MQFFLKLVRHLIWRCLNFIVGARRHLFVVRSKTRETFIAQMAAQGIECGIHYPIPIHHQAAYSECKHLSFPVAEAQASDLVSLPLNYSIE